MFSELINLVEVVSEKIAGELHATSETKREVFAEVQSVGMREVYEAHAHGLKPSIKFILADYLDYDNEEFIEYKNKTYKIIRVYQKAESNEIEITCEHTLNKG